MVKLYNTYTKIKNFVTGAKPTNVGNEVSSEESKIFNQWSFGHFENPDTLVGKKGLRVYNSMSEDEQVKAASLVKKYAALSTGWTIKPGDDKDKLSQELADFSISITKGIKGTFYDSLLGIMSAWDFGFSISEIVKYLIPTGRFKGKVGIRAIKTKEPYSYGFRDDIYGNIEAITFNADIGNIGREFNPDDFVIYSYNKKFYSNHYGRSDFRAAYRSFFSKNVIMKFHNIFLERFGAPTAYATYPEGTKKKILTAIDEILRNLQAKSAFRIPDTVKMELLEATRRGDAGYEKAIAMHNTLISRAILMPELLGFGDRASGSQALGETQKDIFEWIIGKYHRDIEETIVFEQILKRIIDINYIVQDEEQYPVFQMNAISEDNMETRVKTIEAGVKIGALDPNEEWIREYMKWPKFDKDELPAEEDRVRPVPVDNPIPEPKPNDNPEKKPVEPEKKHEHSTPEKFTLVEKYQLHRKPTKVEEKVGFETYADEIKKADDWLREKLVKHFTVQRDKLLRDVERNKVVETKDFKFINRLQVSEVGKIKVTLQFALIKMYLDSKIKILEELQTAGEPVTITKKFADLAAPIPFENWEPVAPAEAIALFDKKVLANIVTEDGVKKLITVANSTELRYFDSRAFAIAGVERDFVLKEAKLILQTGIKQGQSAREVQGKLKDIFDVYIPTGEVKDGKVVSPARLETIVRTNVSDAVNQGRESVINNPLVKNFVPFVLWSAIIDQRTTEYCEWMDGREFRHNDPLLNSPPAHFNCRSIIVPITKLEVERAGGVEPSEVEDNPIPRAKGFEEGNLFNLLKFN